MTNITQIIIALIGLCSTIITAVIVPYVKNRLSDSQWNKLKELVATGVAAAEQLSRTGEISKEERKDYVVDLIKKSGVIESLAKYGITVNIEEIYDMIEAEVYILPNKITNTEYKKMAEQAIEAKISDIGK